MVQAKNLDLGSFSLYVNFKEKKKKEASANDINTGCLRKPRFSEFLHILGFVHVPRPPPLALGVFVTCYSLSVNLLALFLPPQILLLFLFGRGDVEVRASLRACKFLSKNHNSSPNLKNKRSV